MHAAAQAAAVPVYVRRFLSEAASLTGDERLQEAGQRLLAAGDRWQVAAELFEQAYGAAQPAELLSKICAELPEIAAQEEMIWEICGNSRRIRRKFTGSLGRLAEQAGLAAMRRVQRRHEQCVRAQEWV